ncbi:MFS transporter [Amycolatopsis rhizosphaerae]|uniref:MFS transporter n=1 Tax=Amycolatopsis rhizosphaerae TaxID=2053003 RepID=A0A558C6H9_9PSEU|nr:MFS transporter [Amycolatopsis rhizosphaerae]
MLMATINSSIVLIALPDIFRGIHINPLESGNTSYLLWMMMGFLVVTAVLVVGFGRLGDMYGRVRMYNLGFAIFALSSVLLALTWMDGGAAAVWMIAWRIVQGIGGAFLMANSSAILTDAFPVRQRGMALGINGVAAIAGSFLGLVIGGLLGPVDWRLVFLVSVPFGVFGTVWAYLKLHDTSERHRAKMDWWGNLTFAVGLIAVLVGITYGIQPYGGHTMGWTSPFVLSCLIGGAVVLVIFVAIELKVPNPLFNLGLFRIGAFTFGNLANLLASLGRGGLQFILIIWLQGIWLPQHGYSFEQTPLWAGIYMLPMTVGFLISAPTSGVLSDRMGGRVLAMTGMLITAASFVLLEVLPVNFDYWAFAAILLLNGLGMGMFASPNRAEVMNSLPANARGAGAGMTATFQNSAMVLSIGLFFSLMIAGLADHLPSAMAQGLTAHGVPVANANAVAQLPPVAVLFAAFLGYNPIEQLLGPVLHQLRPDQASFLTGRSFFPNLISEPFSNGLTAAFWFAIIVCLVAALASWFARAHVPATAAPASRETVGAELAAEAGELVGTETVATTGTANSMENSTDPHGASHQRQPGAVSGRLRTPGGSPVPGAVVTVTGEEGLQAGRARADESGTYRIEELAPGTYTLIVTAPGFQPAAASVTVTAFGAVHDFVVPGGGVVAGTVRRTGGLPLAGTVVLATDAEGRLVGQATTAGDGTFLLSGLPAGEVVVTANVENHHPRAITVLTGGAEPAVVELLVEAAGVLHGTVTGPDEAPLANATVTLADGGGRTVATAVTGADGRYELRDLEPGEYTVVTSLYEPAVRQVDLSSGESATVDMDLAPGARADAAS